MGRKTMDGNRTTNWGKTVQRFTFDLSFDEDDDAEDEAPKEEATPEPAPPAPPPQRSEEHTSELQSLMRISYAVFCLKKKTNIQQRKQYKINEEKQNISNNNERTTNKKTKK